MSTNKRREADRDDVQGELTDELPGKIAHKRTRSNVDPYACRSRLMPPLAKDNETWGSQLRKAAASGVGPAKNRPQLPASLVGPGSSTEGRMSLTLADQAASALTAAASGSEVPESGDPESLSGRDQAPGAVDQEMGLTGKGQVGDRKGEAEDGWEDEDAEPCSMGPKRLPKEARTLLKELYDGEGDRSAYTALLALLEHKKKKGTDRRKLGANPWGKKGGKRPWSQDGAYEVTTGVQHRDKEQVAMAGYIRSIILELMGRKSPKDPLPGPPPPHVSAPTSTAFYIDWKQNEKSLFNATAAWIVTERVAQDWPNLYEKDDDQVFDMKKKKSDTGDVMLIPGSLYEHRLRVIESTNALSKHGRLIETLGIEGTSSDEEDPARKGVYVIKRRKELSAEVNHLKEQLDLAYEILFKGPGSKGNQARKRIDVGVQSKRKLKITGLPVTCMDHGWLIKLTDVQRDMFQFDEAFVYDFSFPKELLETSD